VEQAIDASTRLEDTRRAMHGMAECLFAGPQHRANGEIALRVTPGGFATTGGLDLRLSGLEIVSGTGERVRATGTFAEVARVLGVDFGPPDIGYQDGSGARASDPLELDESHAHTIESWFVLSDKALRTLDPGQTPVLWPEHFDVAVLLDGHSFGSSPGDEAHPRPYAYVSAPQGDGSSYFNVEFGALRDATDLATAEELLAFWREGLARIATAAR
jgi:hypothetical protein